LSVQSRAALKVRRRGEPIRDELACDNGDAAMTTSKSRTSDSQAKRGPETPDFKDAEPGGDADKVGATEIPTHQRTSVAEQVDKGKVPDPPGTP
jgi:hypothetical protein